MRLRAFEADRCETRAVEEIAEGRGRKQVQVLGLKPLPPERFDESAVATLRVRHLDDEDPTRCKHTGSCRNLGGGVDGVSR